MSRSRSRIRPRVWVPLLGFLIVLGAIVVLLEPRRTTVGSSPQHGEGAPAVRASQPPKAVGTRTPAARPVEPDPVPFIENQVWGDIDLREVQAMMPDNLYWKLGAPTNDPAVLEARDKEKARRNEEYGRVLSGDASEDEVRAYYDYRKRLSTDYLEFADYMRRRFDSSLSDEFKGMLELAVKLHTARLAQIPADQEGALEHARERAKIREEWRKEQEELGNPEPPPQPGPESTGAPDAPGAPTE